MVTLILIIVGLFALNLLSGPILIMLGLGVTKIMKD